jgi:hypothetical protein
MNEYQLLGLVMAAAVLVLVGSGLRGRGLSFAKGVRLAMVWLGIFLIVFLFISVVTGDASARSMPAYFT